MRLFLTLAYLFVLSTPALNQTRDSHDQQLRDLVERWVVAINTSRSADVMDDFLTPDYIWHLSGEDVRGREEVKSRFAATFANQPDFHLQAEDVIPSGDKVVVRWTSRGTRRDTGELRESATISIDRVVNGKFAEGWEVIGGQRWMDAKPAPRRP